MPAQSRQDIARQKRRKAEVLASLWRHPFYPAYWLPNPHLQSCWGPLCRRKVAVSFDEELWETPDNDLLHVYIHRGQPEQPWVLLLHGLEGSIDSFYIGAYTHRFHARGWNVAAFEFRTCGGRANKVRRAYHMGETTDLDFVVRTLRQRIDPHPLAAVGTSLGGNVLAKWLGEQGETAADLLQAAVVVSPPFDPAKSAPQFQAALGGLYMRHFMKTLLPKALEKVRLHGDICDIEKLQAARTFSDFDTLFTAPLHGFDDARDYWTRVGCHQFLENICVPTLLIASSDDPFNHPETVPWDAVEQSPWLHGLFTPKGGHVGFVAGPPHRPRYWNEVQAERFLAEYLPDQANSLKEPAE